MPHPKSQSDSKEKGGASIKVDLKAPLIVGYVPSWSVWRPEPYKYGIEDVRGDLITHVLYAFINVEPDGTLVHPDTTGGDYVKLQELKIKYPNLKVVPSVGGATYTYQIQQIIKSDQSMQNFANNCRTFVDQYGFDGIDIDWEYPTVEEKSKYTRLIELTRAAMGSDLWLMSAVPAGKQNFVGFDPVAMNTYLDAVSVMTYDFHGAGWETSTGHNAPLTGPGDYTTTAAMTLWAEYGVQPEKMVVGLPFYGRTWTLADPNNHGVGAPSSGPGLPGPLGTPEYLGWNEYNNMTGWTEAWDSSAQVPYAWKDNQWLSFDNQQSLALKIDFASTNGNIGVMIWDLAFDSQITLLPDVYESVMNAWGTPAKLHAKSSDTTTKKSPTSKAITTSPTGKAETKVSPK